MELIGSPTELTTSATDAVLALECVVIMAFLRSTKSEDFWRTVIWRWVFGLMAFAAFLGAFAHGLKMPDAIRNTLWKPLYLSLGILVGLFIVGAVADWRGWAAAKRLLPWSIGLGAAFFGLTQLLTGTFIIFIIYETFALVGALCIYIFLAAGNRLPGASVVAVGILLNLVAAVVQTSHVSFHLLLPFDHNGVFHLIQMVGTAMLGLGVWYGMRPGKR